jgi:TraR antiactivator
MQNDIADMLQGQQREVMERAVVEEILTHRRLLNEAQALHDQLMDDDQNPAADPAYTSMMAATLAQQDTLATLIDILGYIPEVGRGKPH